METPNHHGLAEGHATGAPMPPSLRSFLHSRFISANGAAAALYLALSLCILRNPRRAARLWRRLAGG